MTNHRTIILTGDGKGKSTSAFGTALRAVGHGHSVTIIQFLKSNDTIGELQSLKLLPRVTIHQLGAGFVPKPTHPAFHKHEQCAKYAWQIAQEHLNNPSLDLLVLDEIFGAMHHGFINPNDLIAAILQPLRPNAIILTGRNAPQEVIAYADTVSHVECIKHAHQQGLKAQKGIEW